MRFAKPYQLVSPAAAIFTMPLCPSKTLRKGIQICFEQPHHRVSNDGGRGRRAELVCNHPELGPLARKPRRRRQKITASRCIDPGCANDEMRPSYCANGFFPRKLARTVNGQWSGLAALSPRLIAQAVAMSSTRRKHMAW